MRKLKNETSFAEVDAEGLEEKKEYLEIKYFFRFYLPDQDFSEQLICLQQELFEDATTLNQHDEEENRVH